MAPPVAVRHLPYFRSGPIPGTGPLRGRSVLTQELTCSAKGCQAAARWHLVWNNPKIHTPERRKTWLACDEHRESLSDFLGARGFLRATEPVEGA